MREYEYSVSIEYLSALYQQYDLCCQQSAFWWECFSVMEDFFSTNMMWWIKFGGPLRLKPIFFGVPSDVPLNYGNFILGCGNMWNLFSAQRMMNPWWIHESFLHRSPPESFEAKKKKQKMSLAEALDRQKKEAEAPWFLRNATLATLRYVTPWEDRGPAKTLKMWDVWDVIAWWRWSKTWALPHDHKEISLVWGVMVLRKIVA